MVAPLTIAKYICGMENSKRDARCAELTCPQHGEANRAASAEKDAYNGWTGCVHCGQTLPHEGTGWRESSRCRLFQRIAEQAWDEGYAARKAEYALDPGASNPYRVLPPGVQRQ